MESLERILKIIEEQDVEFIYLLFVDIKGYFRSIQTPARLIYQTVNYGFIVNMSNIEYFKEEGFINLLPDIGTFTILPWRPQQGKCASMICQMRTLNDKNLILDTRNVLEQTMKKCINKGMFFDIVPSIQFYAFHTDDNGLPTTITHNQATEFDFGSDDFGVNLRRDITFTLEECDIMFSSCLAKSDSGLQEINLEGADLKTVCDSINFTKSVCQVIAKRHGLYACFIPKPTNDVRGSCMRLKFKCENDEERNIFYDENDPNKLSTLAYCFIAGILNRIREITLITNPLINSYKRLASNQKSNFVAWTSNCINTNSILQIVPSYIESDVMIQINSVDMSSNVYLALSLLIEAGLEGIENNLTVPKEFNMELLNRTGVELENLGIGHLPLSMVEALYLFKKSEFAKRILGENIFSQIIKIKENEYDEFKKYVSEWEIQKYIQEF